MGWWCYHTEGPSKGPRQLPRWRRSGWCRPGTKNIKYFSHFPYHCSLGEKNLRWLLSLHFRNFQQKFNNTKWYRIQICKCKQLRCHNMSFIYGAVMLWENNFILWVPEWFHWGAQMSLRDKSTCKNNQIEGESLVQTCVIWCVIWCVICCVIWCVICCLIWCLIWCVIWCVICCVKCST